MRQKSLFVYAAAFLAVLIPAPGRFVYGVTLMLELLFLMLTGTLVNSLVNRLRLEAMRSVIILLTLISSAVLYRQLFVAFQTEVALVLDFIFYLPATSLFLLDYLFEAHDDRLLVRLRRNSVRTAVFALFGLLFFLFRDIAGFGTLTFFGKNHQIKEVVLLNPDSVGIFEFFASIPGAMVLSGLLLLLYLFVEKKMKVFDNVEAHNAIH